MRIDNKDTAQIITGKEYLMAVLMSLDKKLLFINTPKTFLQFGGFWTEHFR